MIFRLPGPPLSKHSSVGALLAEGVNVAIGVIEESAARNTRFEIAWVSLSSSPHNSAFLTNIYL